MISLNPEFFSSKSESKKLVILSKINSGFSAKLVSPPLDVVNDFIRQRILIIV